MEANSPDTSRRRRTLKDVGISNLAVLVLTCLWLVWLLSNVGNFVRIYTEYRLILPSITIFFINIWGVAGLGCTFIVWFVCGTLARPKKLSEAIGKTGII